MKRPQSDTNTDMKTNKFRDVGPHKSLYQLKGRPYGSDYNERKKKSYSIKVYEEIIDNLAK